MLGVTGRFLVGVYVYWFLFFNFLAALQWHVVLAYNWSILNPHSSFTVKKHVSYLHKIKMKSILLFISTFRLLEMRRPKELFEVWQAGISLYTWKRKKYQYMSQHSKGILILIPQWHRIVYSLQYVAYWNQIVLHTAWNYWLQIQPLAGGHKSIDNNIIYICAYF